MLGLKSFSTVMFEVLFASKPNYNNNGSGAKTTR